MGRYFNDDLTDDMNDDYDAYLEHYGIPKIKWSAEARAKYDQLHHKTEDSLKKAKRHVNSIGKQAYRSISDTGKSINKKATNTKNYFTKKRTFKYSQTDPFGDKTTVSYRTTKFDNDRDLAKMKRGQKNADRIARSHLSEGAKIDLSKANDYFNYNQARKYSVKVKPHKHDLGVDTNIKVSKASTDFEEDLSKTKRRIKEAFKPKKNKRRK